LANDLGKRHIECCKQLRVGARFDRVMGRRADGDVTIFMSKAASTPNAGGEQQSILVVDDETEVADLLKAILLEAGYSVKVATSSQEAVQLLEDAEFSLLVLDWYLGGKTAGCERVTGRAVFQKCRQRYPATPIVTISGVTGVDVREDVLLMDADSFLAKPFSCEVFVRHIRRWLGRSSGKTGEFRFHRVEEIIPMDELRKRYLRAVVEFQGGNISRAAEKLGMHRHTVATVLENNQP
jgi:DNA-binding NtrC family response regulator